MSAMAFNNGSRSTKCLFRCLLVIISIIFVLFILVVFKFFSGDFIGRGSDPESLTIQPDSLGLNTETAWHMALSGYLKHCW